MSISAVQFLSAVWLLVLWLFVMWLCPGPRISSAADAADVADVRSFLQSHCVACHGGESPAAGLRLDRLEGFRAEDRHLWTLVHEQLLSGAMPPKEEPRPDGAEQRRVLEWIATQQRANRPGGTRRLNRRELSAALRDVTGLGVDFSFALPDDGRVNGFDTGIDGLQDSADAVAQIMQVTRRAVEALRFTEPANGEVIAVELRGAKDAKQAFDRWKAAGVTISNSETFARPGTGLLIKPKWLGEKGGFTIRVRPPEHGRLGVLRLTLSVSAAKFHPGVPNPRLWVVVGGRDLGFPEITNSPDEPRTLTYDVSLQDAIIDAKGLAIELINRVELPYSVAGFQNEDRSKPDENIPGGTGLFRPSYDHKARTPEEQPVPFVVLHRIEIDVDHHVAWSVAEGSEAEARRLLLPFMDRAWRRPVDEPEVERFVALFRSLREQELSFDDALRGAFQAVLMSGSFRYLSGPGDVLASDVAGPASGTEPDANSEGSPRPETDRRAAHALASRLSFLLWGAPPDRELRELAAANKLREPDVLTRQANRLLDDPRSEAFLQPFVTQWLELGQPITVAMDHIQKQDFRFGRNLKASMQEETVAYVARMLAENRPARELLASDWTMMNDILARHYGYDGIEGGQLRPVTLRADDPRGGGLLAQAGIQSMLCWMGENWLIYRGAWTLRHILDMPPPPPPLEVPELIPSDGKNHGKTFRELLRQHQEDTKCAVCHRTIDSLGFAFQNFDLSGRWRELEFEKYERSELDGKIAWRGAGRSRPVDASGTLPRGESFASFAECRSLLVKNYQPDLVRGLLKNFVLYGTGRVPDIDDLAELRRIMAAREADGFRLRDLLLDVIGSRAFRER